MNPPRTAHRAQELERPARSRRKPGTGGTRSYYIPAPTNATWLPLRVTEFGESWWSMGEVNQRVCSPILALEFVHEGRLHLEQDGSSSEIGPGELFILRRGGHHAYRAAWGPVRKSYIGLDGPSAEWMFSRLPDRIIPSDRPRCRALLARIRRLLQRQPSGWQEDASCTGYALLVELLSSASGVHERSMPDSLVRILGRLESPAGHAVRIEELARAAGLSPAHLHRLFKVHLGTTPRQYANIWAMKKAQAELIGSGLTCAAIAADLGYQPLYFSAVFKRVVGISPREFRQRYR